MKKPLVILLALLGLVFVGLAVYYFVTPANSLPSWFPGYNASQTSTHLKHSIACLVLAAGCGVLAWFMGGKKDQSGPTTPTAPLE